MGRSLSTKLERRQKQLESQQRISRLLFFGIIFVFILVTVFVLIQKQAEKGPFDINTASAAQLEKLPGVGPETAKAIIAGRPYQASGDLDKVKGIGPKTTEKLRPQLKFPSDGQPVAPSPGS